MASSARSKAVVAAVSIGGLVGLLLASRDNYEATGQTPSMLRVVVMCLVIALAAQGWASVLSHSKDTE